MFGRNEENFEMNCSRLYHLATYPDGLRFSTILGILRAQLKDCGEGGEVFWGNCFYFCSANVWGFLRSRFRVSQVERGKERRQDSRHGDRRNEFSRKIQELGRGKILMPQPSRISYLQSLKCL